MMCEYFSDALNVIKAHRLNKDHYKNKCDIKVGYEKALINIYQHVSKYLRLNQTALKTSGDRMCLVLLKWVKRHT